MRKIIASEFYTIDGLMSDPDDQMDWVMANFSPEMGKYEKDLYGSSDTLMLGRVTYKIFEGYWPSAETSPSTPKEEMWMAHKINEMQKIVFSRSLKSLSWKNSTLIADLIPEEINTMKEQPGRDILVIGSANIVQQLTNSGLIDEYHLLLHPVILGEGKPLFKDLKERHDLDLIKTETFSNGVVLLQYQPVKR
jgi:dihydrofolate reductase